MRRGSPLPLPGANHNRERNAKISIKHLTSEKSCIFVNADRAVFPAQKKRTMLHTILRLNDKAALLAKANSIKVVELETRLLIALLTLDIIINNDQDFWNLSLRALCENALEPLEKLAFEVFGREISPDDRALFEQLEIIGSGDCEMCGGKLEVIEGLYKDYGDDYNSPLWERKRCTRCHYTFRIEY